MNNVRKVRNNPESRVDFWTLKTFQLGFHTVREKVLMSQPKGSSQESTENITYNFSPKNISLQPFKNFKIFDAKVFKLIKDFNFNIFPSNINIRGDLNRSLIKRNTEIQT